MTDHPDFTWNEKTGEVSRGGKLMSLRLRYAEIMSLLWRVPIGDYVASETLADHLDLPQYDVANVVGGLRSRLKPLGVSITGKRGAGYCIVIGDMPKWSPKIPAEHPPVNT